MIRRVVSLALALAGCAEPKLELVLRSDGAQALVFARSVNGAGLEISASSAEASDGLPLTTGLDSEIDVTVVAYGSPLEELGLAPGPLLAPTQGEMARALPQGGAVYRAHVAAGDLVGTGFEEVAELPPALASFRFGSACPTTASAPLEVDRACPPVFRPRPADCWGPLVEIPALYDAGFAMVGAVREEEAASWLYLSHARWGQASFARHVRVRMIDPVTPDLDGATEIGTLPPIVQRGADDWEVAGWTPGPDVREDGLEVFFSSSYPDRNWHDEDAYRSTRARVGDRFALAENVLAVGRATNDGDPITQPRLLADWRTLVWIDYGLRSRMLTFGWRGDRDRADFVRAGAVKNKRGEEVSNIFGVFPSCDGGHLFYVQARQLMIAKILELPADASGELVVEQRPFDELHWPAATTVESLAESPDCARMYLTDRYKVFVTERVACGG